MDYDAALSATEGLAPTDPYSQNKIDYKNNL